MTSVTNNFIVEPVFVCSLCLIEPKPESPTNDNRLTVIGGEMVCVDHQGFVIQRGPFRRRMLVRGLDPRFPNIQ